MEELMNIREVGKVLSVSPATVIDLVKCGELAAYKVGGARVDRSRVNHSTSGLRFEAQDVREYLASVLIK